LETGLDALKREARSYKSVAFAESTKRSYRTHMFTYLRFCFYYGLCPIPAVQETLNCYVAHLARTHAPSSISVYLNIIRILHVEAGFDNPLVLNYEVNMIRRGVLRAKGVPPRQKAPMTVAILLRLYDTVDFSLTSERAFWCALILGFFGLLRKSSLIPVSKSILAGKRLNRGDVSRLCLEAFYLSCAHSKTNQFGQRVHVIPFVACSERRICPVFAVLSHFGASELPKTSPLFNFVVACKEIFHSHAMFVNRLKRGVKQCGLDDSQISCHSLRRGGATFIFECGVSADLIKLRGDWKSNCYQQYLVISPDLTFASARTMSVVASERAVSPR
jgi:integrase